MPSWLHGVFGGCTLASKFKGERLPIPNELRQLPYFQKRFKNKYAHLYKAHDERGLKCPMDVKTMEDIVSFCQHVMRSDDIVGSTKDQARIFLARVLNVYNAQNPVPGAMDEDVFDSTGKVKRRTENIAEAGSATGTANETAVEKPPLPVLQPDQAEQLEAAAVRLSAEQDRRRVRRLERHIVKLEARLTLLEPDSSDDSQSPVTTGKAKPSIEISRDPERERDFGKQQLNMGLGGLVRAGFGAGGNGSLPRAASSGGGNSGGLARAGSGTGSIGNGNGNGKNSPVKEKEPREVRELRDKESKDKDLREAKILPAIKKLPRGTPPQIRTPRQLRTPPPPPPAR